jgi:hypothetical protein
VAVEVIVVVVVPAAVMSHVPSTIMSLPAREAFTHRVWRPVGPDQLAHGRRFMGLPVLP